MKITRKQLRQIINEAAENPYGLADSYALINNWLPGNANGIFILFDAERALAEIRDINESREYSTFFVALLNSIKGMIRIDSMGRNNRNPYGAYQVSYAGASPGYGPLMYDLVMSVVPGGIYPDRRSVSKSARGVWKYYADNRPDVVKSYIDNFSNPKTDNRYDDGIRYVQDKDTHKRYNVPFEPTRSFGDKNLPPDAYLNMTYSMPGADVNNNQEANLMEDNYKLFLEIVDGLEIKSDAMKYYKKHRTWHPIESIKALTGTSIDGVRREYFSRVYKGESG